MEYVHVNLGLQAAKSFHTFSAKLCIKNHTNKPKTESVVVCLYIVYMLSINDALMSQFAVKCKVILSHLINKAERRRLYILLMVALEVAGEFAGKALEAFREVGGRRETGPITYLRHTELGCGE